MSQHPPDADLLERARRALAEHDATAEVDADPTGAALRVHSRLPQGEVLGILKAAALPVATVDEAPARSDCCGGCCGG
jgi:hypothetical protein